MSEEHQSSSTSDQINHQLISTNETKNSKKLDNQKENSLYTEPVPKCYIGQGNNSEL